MLWRTKKDLRILKPRRMIRRRKIEFNFVTKVQSVKMTLWKLGRSFWRKGKKEKAVLTAVRAGMLGKQKNTGNSRRMSGMQLMWQRWETTILSFRENWRPSTIRFIFTGAYFTTRCHHIKKHSMRKSKKLLRKNYKKKRKIMKKKWTKWIKEWKRID